MNRNQLAHLFRCRRAGVRGSLDRAYIAPNHDGYKASAHLLLAHELHVGGFHHGVCRFNGAHQSLCFDHTKRIRIHFSSILS